LAGEALIAAAALMGLAGLPHCVAMCAAPCAAVTRGGTQGQFAFHLARVGGYAAAGAVAALGIGLLREGLAWSPLLRPLWTLLHLGALAFGLWMLWRGRWPAALQRGTAAAPAAAGGRWQPIVMPLRSGAAGALWIAWPCALSQSALLVAALASQPQQGAAAMAAFAIASSPALWLGPAVLRGWRARRGALALGAEALWPVRLAGACMALGSAWALGHGLWMRVAEWCGWA
jgi:sulfite exporter TauE/SafE